jgi:beta-xylosidase
VVELDPQTHSALGRTVRGVKEVAAWSFEVWNEPNLKAFWTGTQKDYFKLYRVTAQPLVGEVVYRCHFCRFIPPLS